MEERHFLFFGGNTSTVAPVFLLSSHMAAPSLHSLLISLQVFLPDSSAPPPCLPACFHPYLSTLPSPLCMLSPPSSFLPPFSYIPAADRWASRSFLLASSLSPSVCSSLLPLGALFCLIRSLSVAFSARQCVLLHSGLFVNRCARRACQRARRGFLRRGNGDQSQPPARGGSAPHHTHTHKPAAAAAAAGGGRAETY